MLPMANGLFLPSYLGRCGFFRFFFLSCDLALPCETGFWDSASFWLEVCSAFTALLSSYHDRNRSGCMLTAASPCIRHMLGSLIPETMPCPE